MTALAIIATVIALHNSIKIFMIFLSFNAPGSETLKEAMIQTLIESSIYLLFSIASIPIFLK